MEYKFSHSGNIGDVIYSLPFCLNCSNQGKISFHLKTNVPADYTSPHPFGKIRMSVQAAKMLVPLLEAQEWAGEISLSDELPEGYYELDEFRRPMLLNISAGSISQWYNILSTKCIYPADLSKPWLGVPQSNLLKGKKIVLFRSSRYRRKGLNYAVLKPFAEDFVFIGLPEEHKNFCDSFFKVDYLPFSTFLEAAQIIKEAKLIIGNQTGLFSIAEGMKVPRLLETAYECPNVVMLGGAFQYIVHTTQIQEVFISFRNAFLK